MGGGTGTGGAPEKKNLGTKVLNEAEKKLEKITFEEAEKLVEDKEAKFKQYKDDIRFALHYKDKLYFKRDSEKAYCIWKKI